MTATSDPAAGVAAHHHGKTSQSSVSHPVILVIFLLTMTQPYYFVFGPLVIGPYRLMLLCLAIPLFFKWLRGSYGRLIASDFLILAYLAWMSLSLIVNGQAGRIPQYVGGSVLDVFVAYLLGRAAIRSRQDMIFFSKVFLLILLCLLPFALIESFTRNPVLVDLAKGAPNSVIKPFGYVSHGQRLGLWRAQTVFSHPIHQGVVCSMGFSLAFYVLKHDSSAPGVVKRAIWGSGTYFGTFLALSAGAYLSLIIQAGLMTWDKVLAAYERRWQLFGGAFVSMYAFLVVAANRPPPMVIAQMIALNSNTAWYRYMLWQYGSAEVMRHPIFGMGLFSDWAKASWMVKTSVDNQWLVLAMRWGIPGVALMIAAYLYVVVRLIRQDYKGDKVLSDMRLALVFILAGTFVTYGTVAAWSFPLSIMMFLLGASVWLFDSPDRPDMEPADAGASDRRGRPAAPGLRRQDARVRYTRYANRSGA